MQIRFLKASCFHPSVLTALLLVSALSAHAQEQSPPPQKFVEPTVLKGWETTPESREASRLFAEAERIRQSGDALLKAGKVDEAITQYKMAEKIWGNFAIYEGLAEAYTRKGQFLEAEKQYHRVFKNSGGQGTDRFVLAKYALLEIRLRHREEAFRAYHLSRKGLDGFADYYPFFDNLMQVKELEAAVRLILLDTIHYTKNEERIAEVEKILDLFPKFAYAHFVLADNLLRGRYLNDRAAYRKAAKPHYEAAVKYGNEDLQKRAQKALQQLQNEEHTSKR